MHSAIHTGAPAGYAIATLHSAFCMQNVVRNEPAMIPLYALHKQKLRKLLRRRKALYVTYVQLLYVQQA